MNECMRCRKRKISIIKFFFFIGVDKVTAKIDSVEMGNILLQMYNWFYQISKEQENNFLEKNSKIICL